MKIKFKFFLFTDGFEIQTTIDKWLEQQNVTIFNTNTVSVENKIYHFVYYVENN